VREVLEQADRTPRRFASVDSLRDWLLRILHASAIDLYRRARCLSLKRIE
jgi:DNA-directed RNA polymerase specialized sigma24 family protein